MKFLCCLAYFMSYLTRINYAVCMVELQSALQIGKSIAGLAGACACNLTVALVPILNSATYVESSLSTYGFGAVAEAVPMLCLRRPGGRPGNCSDAQPWAAWPGERIPRPSPQKSVSSGPTARRSLSGWRA